MRLKQIPLYNILFSLPKIVSRAECDNSLNKTDNKKSNNINRDRLQIVLKIENLS